MSRRRAVAVALVAAGLLAGCSGEEDADPAPSSTSQAPSSARTPPPISPRTTVTFSPGSTLPGTVTPPPGSGLPVPVPSAPES
ncbi:hypothetical protein [Modestobacter versicolor]|uniref:ABC-type glycerol-3-phosphate transport system substrate-binding protein n=1 Tax=Modestobacter versicolor TaxID=429133 RepID=A0A839XZQ1_9ACTN|nr:hypothetical protein [Modestobacter versicolor]MBB3675707.1 ABC-type glycerol-3-phosphate transport system substrate-binding protein [Modestobacter versicolor]